MVLLKFCCICALIIVDNVNIYSYDSVSHLNDLNRIFDEIQISSLKLKIKKYTLDLEKLLYLNHIVFS